MYGALIVFLGAIILGWLAFRAQETKPPQGVKRKGDGRGWHSRFANDSHPEGPGFLNTDCPHCNSADYERGVPCASCGFEPPWHEPPRLLSRENLLPALALLLFVALVAVVIADRMFGLGMPL